MLSPMIAWTDLDCQLPLSEWMLAECIECMGNRMLVLQFCFVLTSLHLLCIFGHVIRSDGLQELDVVI